MAHNVYKHIRAVQRANALTDVECVAYNPDWRTWHKTKKKSKASEPSLWVPRDLLYFNNFIKELFISDNPMQMIDDASPLLQSLNHQTWNDGNTEIFQSLFSDDDSLDDEHIAETDETNLNALEADLRQVTE